eukprot:CAMPEP_0179331236 /NCGR_PEP_ID=MMETSP0797-20121207/64090_1 /TAXON_ID=47934 /ORGANISM="Dinophysis acuminata, Strain DAEP01" /LENGTH=140 /DNA_ID=CAMNT_0021044019 /DNA_START=151 /DNA_END=570 /DNA_ORIENTATION=-
MAEVQHVRVFSPPQPETPYRLHLLPPLARLRGFANERLEPRTLLASQLVDVPPNSGELLPRVRDEVRAMRPLLLVVLKILLRWYAPAPYGGICTGEPGPRPLRATAQPAKQTTRDLAQGVPVREAFKLAGNEDGEDRAAV